MSLLHLIALLLALHVALGDLYARRVSNRALLVAACSAAITLVTPLGDIPVSAALAGAVLGLAALLPFYAVGWMGAGDVKFFATLGLLLGWQALLPVWVVASLLAGLHSIAVLAAHRLAGHAPLQLVQWQGRLADSLWCRQVQAARQGRRGAPYAAYLAAGTAVLLLVMEVPGHA